MRVLTHRGIDGVDKAMERYANGDGAAFAEVYDTLAPRLLRFMRKATHDATAAEDLVQETLLQIHRARGSFIPGAPVAPWAFAIARRLLIDGTRRRRVELRLFKPAAADDDRAPRDAPATTASADDVLDAHRLLGRIQQRLAAFPQAQRNAYHLVKQEGLSLKKTAEVLGTSVTAVKLRTHRVYKALRNVLREEGVIS